MLHFKSMSKALSDAGRKAKSPSKEESRENRTDSYSSKKQKSVKIKVRGKMKTLKGWL